MSWGKDSQTLNRPKASGEDEDENEEEEKRLKKRITHYGELQVHQTMAALKRVLQQGPHFKLGGHGGHGTVGLRGQGRSRIGPSQLA
jgi:hypothetical protein